MIKLTSGLRDLPGVVMIYPQHFCAAFPGYECTLVTMVGDATVSVKETPEEVARLVEEALRDE